MSLANSSLRTVISIMHFRSDDCVFATEHGKCVKAARGNERIAQPVFRLDGLASTLHENKEALIREGSVGHTRTRGETQRAQFFNSFACRVTDRAQLFPGRPFPYRGLRARKHRAAHYSVHNKHLSYMLSKRVLT